MDDDLDFSNDQLLRRIQHYRDAVSIPHLMLDVLIQLPHVFVFKCPCWLQIDGQLEECRSNLQATVDQISWIENKREVERVTIEKEFEKLQYEIQYILDKRKKQVLLELDEEIDSKRTTLLGRAKSYQTKIIEAAELQPSLLSLQNYEKTIHSNILQASDLTKEK